MELYNAYADLRHLAKNVLPTAKVTLDTNFARYLVEAFDLLNDAYYESGGHNCETPEVLTFVSDVYASRMPNTTVRNLVAFTEEFSKLYTWFMDSSCIFSVKQDTGSHRKDCVICKTKRRLYEIEFESVYGWAKYD